MMWFPSTNQHITHDTTTSLPWDSSHFTTSTLFTAQVVAVFLWSSFINHIYIMLEPRCFFPGYGNKTGQMDLFVPLKGSGFAWCHVFQRMDETEKTCVFEFKATYLVIDSIFQQTYIPYIYTYRYIHVYIYINMILICVCVSHFFCWATFPIRNNHV